MLQVQSPNGATHEVQILPKEVAAIAEDTHELYEQSRDGEKPAQAELKEKNAAAMEKFNERQDAPDAMVFNDGERPAEAARGNGEFSAKQNDKGEWGVANSEGNIVQTADSKQDAEAKAAEATTKWSPATRTAKDAGEPAEKSLSTKPEAESKTALALQKGDHFMLPGGRSAKVQFYDGKNTKRARVVTEDGTKVDNIPGKDLTPVQVQPRRKASPGLPLTWIKRWPSITAFRGRSTSASPSLP